jgi:hypothetical protein
MALHRDPRSAKSSLHSTENSKGCSVHMKGDGLNRVLYKLSVGCQEVLRAAMQSMDYSASIFYLRSFAYGLVWRPNIDMREGKLWCNMTMRLLVK